MLFGTFSPAAGAPVDHGLGFDGSGRDVQLVPGVQPAEFMAEAPKHIARGNLVLTAARARTCAICADRICLSVATGGGVVTQTIIGSPPPGVQLAESIRHRSARRGALPADCDTRSAGGGIGRLVIARGAVRDLAGYSPF